MGNPTLLKICRKRQTKKIFRFALHKYVRGSRSRIEKNWSYGRYKGVTNFWKHIVCRITGRQPYGDVSYLTIYYSSDGQSLPLNQPFTCSSKSNTFQKKIARMTKEKNFKAIMKSIVCNNAENLLGNNC